MTDIFSILGQWFLRNLSKIVNYSLPNYVIHLIYMSDVLLNVGFIKESLVSLNKNR
jgi:hypothetical protein